MMKKAILGTLAVPLLVISTMASANQFLYTSLGDGTANNDAALQGSFIYDAVLEEYTDINLTVDHGAGVISSNFGNQINNFTFPGDPMSTSFQSMTSTGTVFSSVGLELFDGSIRAGSFVNPLTWVLSGVYQTGTDFINIPNGVQRTTNFSVAVVPEPSTYAMMGLGLFGVFAATRRKSA